MGRFLLLVVLIVVAIWVIRRALVRLKHGQPDGTPPGAPATQGDLVKCAHCGTHLPLAEARAVGDRLYCSDEHARLGPRIGPRDG